MKDLFVRELKQELAMRRKVWPRIAGKTELFTKMEHNNAYRIMQEMVEIFDEMTDQELNKIRARIARKRDEQDNQTVLF